MKRAARLLSFLLLSAVLFTCVSAGGYDAPRVVKVGFFYKPEYHVVLENGERDGYGYDYLNRLATYANWTYEYIGYDKSWSEMLSMLESGEIDLLTAVQKNALRLERFDFSDLPVAYSSTIVTVRAGSENYIAEDPSCWASARVGLLRASARNAGFDEFMTVNGAAGYTPVYFDKYADMLAELREGGAIDIAVTDSMRPLNDEWILARFDTQSVYAAVRKGNAELLEQLNDAQGKLYADNPHALSELDDKYYSVEGGELVPFTAEERQFIEDMRGTRFTAVINPDREPFSWVEDGFATGILTDIAQLAISRSGLNVDILNADSYADYERLIESGDADIVLDEWFDRRHAEGMGYKLTDPYIKASVSRLYMKEHGNDISVMAAVRGSGVLKQYGDDLAGKYTLKVYDTVADAVKAVKTGECDAACLYYHTAERLAYNDDLNQLAIDKLYSYGTEFSIAVSSRRNVLLLSVLNKSLSGISEQLKDGIVAKYAYYPEKPFSILRYISMHPILSILISVGALLMICLAAFLITSIKRREREHVGRLEEQSRNELLNDALATAETASNAKSQFLSHVSHELRTPLNSIIGYIELARETPDNLKKMRSYLDSSESSAKQLLSLINNVLDVSAIERGRLKLAQETFDLKALLSALAKTYTSECQRKGLRFELIMLTRVDDWLVGDQLRLSQILTNLLGNAVKFTDRGSVRLSVSQLSNHGGTTSVRFEVADTGCGISEDMLHRIWMPFEQDSAATARRYGGSGLGLSIVKSLVTIMDGVVDVKSKQNEGSAFTVELPFSSYREQSGEKLSGLESTRVLVADDTREDCDYLSLVLDRMNIRHTCVYSGEDALDALELAHKGDDPYNVCLIDWSMPDMNGLEAARRIRARYGSDIGIAIMSALEIYNADKRVKDAGADAFADKPLFQSTIFDLLMSLTGGRLVTPPTSVTADSFKGRRLLMAEDNRQNRDVLVELLQNSGLICDTVENGRLAVDMFTSSRKGTYDAVLMDVRMPVMDGLEATRLIRLSSHPDAKTVPIIAVSANAFAEDVAKSLQCGMDAHISKPVDMDALLSTLMRLMGRR